MSIEGRAFGALSCVFMAKESWRHQHLSRGPLECSGLECSGVEWTKLCLDEEHHPPCLLVVPSLLPLPLPPLHLLQRQPPPGPLDGGGGQPRHLALEHRLRPLLDPDGLERLAPLGWPPGDPAVIQVINNDNDKS